MLQQLISLKVLLEIKFVLIENTNIFEIKEDNSGSIGKRKLEKTLIIPCYEFDEIFCHHTYKLCIQMFAYFIDMYHFGNSNN